MSERLEAIKRLKNELTILQKDPFIPGVTVDKINNDIFHWKVTMLGPEKTPYEGGLFMLQIDFPENYPKSRPHAKFVTKMYHRNVDEKSGNICITTLFKYEENTAKGTEPPTAAELLNNIWGLFYEPTYLGVKGTEEYRINKANHDAKAREYTQKYALYNK